KTLRQQRHGGPAYAERGGNSVLRGVECLRSQPLAALHQPARQPLFRRVDRVAGRDLLRLRKDPLAAELDEAGDFRVGLSGRQQMLGRNTNEVSPDEGAGLSGAVGGLQRELPDGSFLPHGGNLDVLTGRKTDRYRNKPGDREQRVRIVVALPENMAFVDG